MPPTTNNTSETPVHGRSSPYLTRATAARNQSSDSNQAQHTEQPPLNTPVNPAYVIQLLKEEERKRVVRNHRRSERRRAEGEEDVSEDEPEVPAILATLKSVDQQAPAQTDNRERSIEQERGSSGPGRTRTMDGDEQSEQEFSEPRGQVALSKSRRKTVSSDDLYFSTSETQGNSFKLNDNTIPPEIGLLARCKRSPPLSLFTADSLSRIRAGQGVKFTKMGTGTHENTRVLDVADFPSEEELTVVQWIACYNAFLEFMAQHCDQEMFEGWARHYDMIINDKHFNEWFPAFRDFDHDVRTQFFSAPYVVNPDEPNWGRGLDLQRMVFLQKSHRPAPTTSMRYQPYPPQQSPQRGARSFREPIERLNLCLRCGQRDGHVAARCGAKKSSRPERRLLVDYQGGNLYRCADGKQVCVRFNIAPICSLAGPQHPLHVCSLCNDERHGARSCTRN